MRGIRPVGRLARVWVRSSHYVPVTTGRTLDMRPGWGHRWWVLLTKEAPGIVREIRFVASGRLGCVRPPECIVCASRTLRRRQGRAQMSRDLATYITQAGRARKVGWRDGPQWKLLRTLRVRCAVSRWHSWLNSRRHGRLWIWTLVRWMMSGSITSVTGGGNIIV